MKFEPSADTLTLREWIKLTLPDEYKTWEDIQAETGVLMDASGKAKLRQAALYENIEYSCIKSKGIILAGPKTGARIVEGRVHGVKRAIQRTSKTYHAISGQFLEDMGEEDRKSVMFVGAAFAAMELASAKLKQVSKPSINGLKIMLPK